MSNYSQVTFFGPKDALLSGDPNKIIHGPQVDTELSAISVAIATKFDTANMGSIAQLAIGSGSAAAPSYAFNADLTTGWYLSAVGILAVATAGVPRGTIHGSGAWTINHQASTNIDVNASELPGLQLRSTGANAVKLAMRAYDAGAEGLIGTLTNHPLNLRTNDTDRITISIAGQVQMLAATSGTTAIIAGTNAVNVQQWTSTVAAASFSLGYGVGLTGGAWNIYAQGVDPMNLGTSGSAAFGLWTNGASRVSIASTGATTINAPASSGIPLSFASLAAGIEWIDFLAGALHGSITNVGQTNLQIGTISVHELDLFTGNQTRFAIAGNGASIQGFGPVAAALVDMTPDSGSFTGTLTGMTSATTGTFKFRRMGNIVSIYLETLTTGTSNATTMTMTGMPASLQPLATREVVCSRVTDNGQGAQSASAQVASSGTITFNLLANTPPLQYLGAFTGSGTKGLGANWTITYPI